MLLWRTGLATACLLSCAACVFGQRTLPLWTATKAEAPQVYLLGSIHVGDDSLFPLPQPMEDALQQSGALAVEVDIDALDVEKLQAEVRRVAALPEGQTLFELLPSDTWFGADAVLTEYRVQLVNYNDVQPWFVLWMLSGLPYAEEGFDPDKGIDVHFIRAAKRREIPVLSLETVEEQIATLSSAGIPEQIELLDATLHQADAEEQSPEDIMEAWKSGDGERLERLLLPAEGEVHSEAVLAFQRRLLDERNERMATRIVDLDAANELPVMVVVGALHMVGPAGVVQMLREQGYTVEQVTLPEAAE